MVVLNWDFHIYSVGHKKGTAFIIPITLSTANQFSWFLAHTYCRKFATRRCI